MVKSIGTKHNDKKGNRQEWIDKERAIKTRSINVLRQLARHDSEFVRLATIFNPNIKKDQKILIDIIRNDSVINLRETALAKLQQIRRL